MRVGIIGATGIVGRELVKILADSDIKISQLKLSASPGSVQKRVQTHLGEQYIEELDENFFEELDLCFFCVSSDISRKWVPVAAARGAVCIDNSSAFRMEYNIPIIIPEVNGEMLKSNPQVISNPNCCVAQLAVALQPLNTEFGLEDVCVSTYQSISGAGQKAVEQVKKESSQYPNLDNKRGQFLFNVIPCIGSCDKGGHCQEEDKIIKETRKILNLPTLPMAVTSVRVPVLRGHSLAVTFTIRKEAGEDEVRKLLAQSPNIIVEDNSENQFFPQPVTAQDTNTVFVGRIRANVDYKPKSFSMWVVADNLRKGAAHNALSIAEAWCSLL